MTEQEAVELAKTEFWKDLTPEAITTFQLIEETKLCMPFRVFHEAIEKVLGRSVYTHEFMDRQKLIDEFKGKRKPPTLKEIIDMIPEEKRITVFTK